MQHFKYDVCSDVFVITPILFLKHSKVSVFPIQAAVCYCRCEDETFPGMCHCFVATFFFNQNNYKYSSQTRVLFHYCKDLSLAAKLFKYIVFYFVDFIDLCINTEWQMCE